MGDGHRGWRESCTGVGSCSALGRFLTARAGGTGEGIGDGDRGQG